MTIPTQFELALAALNAELADIATWSGAPQDAYSREMQQKGQLDLDYQNLNKRLQDLRAVLPPSRHAEFDGCVKEVKMAFGAMIIHAGFSYENQLDVMRGWPEAWAKLDSALKGMNFFLGTLAAQKERPSRSGGSGGPRTDLFTIDQSCA
jgi:hypothetical protein